MDDTRILTRWEWVKGFLYNLFGEKAGEKFWVYIVVLFFAPFRAVDFQSWRINSQFWLPNGRDWMIAWTYLWLKEQRKRKV